MSFFFLHPFDGNIFTSKKKQYFLVQKSRKLKSSWKALNVLLLFYRTSLLMPFIDVMNCGGSPGRVCNHFTITYLSLAVRSSQSNQVRYFNAEG